MAIMTVERFVSVSIPYNQFQMEMIMPSMRFLALSCFTIISLAACGGGGGGLSAPGLDGNSDGGGSDQSDAVIATWRGTLEGIGTFVFSINSELPYSDHTDYRGTLMIDGSHNCLTVKTFENAGGTYTPVGGDVNLGVQAASSAQGVMTIVYAPTLKEWNLSINGDHPSCAYQTITGAATITID